MLIENTGIAMMDSGGGENRGWQRNQKKSIVDFKNEPEVTIDDASADNSKEIEYTVSLFHYLTRQLELDILCNEYNALECKDWDGTAEIGVYGVSKKQAEWIKKHGFEIKDTFNSYNGDSSLSQVIQGTWLKIGVENYLLLQIHGGCDVRGGYTDAKLFYLSDEAFLSEDVYGEIDGVEVENTYDGVNITNENGEPVPVKKNSKITLGLSI